MAELYDINAGFVNAVPTQPEYRQPPVVPTVGDDLLFQGARTAYPHYDDNVHPEAFREGVNVRSLVNARGGPNLLAVAREQQALSDPLYDPTWPSHNDVHGELWQLFSVTQHRVWERNQEAMNDRTPKFFTGPRFTGSQVLIDPRELVKAKQGESCSCVNVTRGVPMNDSLYWRVRYPAD